MRMQTAPREKGGDGGKRKIATGPTRGDGVPATVHRRGMGVVAAIDRGRERDK